MNKYIAESKCIVDDETGEVVSKRFHRMSKFESKKFDDKYIMLFEAAISELLVLKSFNAIMLLFSITKKADYSKGEVRLPSATRKAIALELGISEPSLNNAMSKLKRARILFGKSGLYTINPKFIYKGKLLYRASLISKMDSEMFSNSNPEDPKHNFVIAA